MNSLSKRHFEHLAAALCAAALLGGCATSKTPAPVEERALGPRATPLIVAGPGTAPALPAADTSKPLPGAENAGKPGYYTVKPGDTMIRVGLESGQNWKDLVKWNNLENANVIEVG
ncbi:MAG TPA: LysM peptidoglycan-binding domain-containing protein, partial [Piscinibacter sp.]|nr:LysM peptidoglycan-binding domain-containing protein [Piscinibacter sp.]